MNCIIQMMEDSNADFFCLKEMTAYSMTRVLEAPFIRKEYFVSGNHISGYGVLIASRYPAFFYESPFPTLQGRSLLICEPINGINGKPFLIGTVHLESGAPNGGIRIKQMELVINAMKSTVNHIIMGDFNFDSTQ